MCFDCFEKISNICHEFKDLLNEYTNNGENRPIDFDKITCDTYIEQFGFDELDKVEIIFLIEEHFKIWVKDDDLLLDGNTVNDVINYIFHEIYKKENNKSENESMKTRFEIITENVDTLAETIYNFKNCRPWDNNKESEIKLIKKWLLEKIND